MAETCGFGCSKFFQWRRFFVSFFTCEVANTVYERNVDAFATAESSSVWIAS